MKIKKRASQCKRDALSFTLYDLLVSYLGNVSNIYLVQTIEQGYNGLER
jgi:hypothetical protein